jgi:hypothetical protein
MQTLRQYVLDQMLSLHGQLAVKYGLREKKDDLPLDFLTIIAELTKLAQSTYGAATFGRSVTARVELLAALTELIQNRLIDARTFGKFVKSPFVPSRDSFDWCKPYPLPANEFDQTSLRAALAAIRTIGSMDELTCSISGKQLTVDGVSRVKVITSTGLFSLMETFGLLNATAKKDAIVLTAR